MAHFDYPAIMGSRAAWSGAKTLQAASSMASNVKFSNPPAIPKPSGYTHVVDITGPARIVYIAGQLGFSHDGKVGDFRAQAVQAFENLKAALASVGATF